MQHPDVQVDIVFMQTVAPLLGRLLGCPPASAIGRAVALWHWALRLPPKGQLPDGVVRDGIGASATVRVERAVHWEGSPGAFVAACLDEDVGLLERTDEGLRVRGLRRYHPHYAKQLPAVRVSKER